jgi:CheY-like chemotaxis protein
MTAENTLHTILLIDDDPLVLKTFYNLLTRERYDVVPASSYGEALKVFEQRKDFDLILSDIRMPGKNGIETVSEIQARLVELGMPDLPIIFITGYAEYGNKLDAKFHGEVLAKPIDNDKLLATIRDYL